MTTSKVDLDEFQHLTDEVRRAQSSLVAGAKGLSAGAELPPTAFGNTKAAPTCENAMQQAQTAMVAVLNAFANTTDSDHMRLEMAKKLYQKTDAEAADELLKVNRDRLDVFSSQTSTDSHPWARTQQLERLRGLAGSEFQGYAIVAGDFNAVSDNGSPSATSIRDFGDKGGFDITAGDIHDGKHGTSASNHRIDYLMSRGLGTSETQRWDRQQSDHDGQLTDVTIPSW